MRFLLVSKRQQSQTEAASSLTETAIGCESAANCVTKERGVPVRGVYCLALYRVAYLRGADCDLSTGIWLSRDCRAYLSYKSDGLQPRLLSSDAIVVVMRTRRIKNQVRGKHAQFGALAPLQRLGIAIVIAFLLWAVALVFIQAWETLRPHTR